MGLRCPPPLRNGLTRAFAFAVSLYGALDSRAGRSQIRCIHYWTECDLSLELQKPRLSQSGDFGRILHIQHHRAASLPIIVGIEIRGFRFVLLDKPRGQRHQLAIYDAFVAGINRDGHSHQHPHGSSPYLMESGKASAILPALRFKRTASNTASCGDNATSSLLLSFLAQNPPRSASRSFSSAAIFRSTKTRAQCPRCSDIQLGAPDRDKNAFNVLAKPTRCCGPASF